MSKPILFIFSGLPGVGKSAYAKKIAEIEKAVYLRIDTVEQGLRDLCSMNIQGEGYRLSCLIAADNLRVGNSVVADCVNPWKLTRDEWKNIAEIEGVNYINIEIKCSNKNEHKERVEKRYSEIPGLLLPPWKKILEMKYDKWDTGIISIETSGKTIEQSLTELVRKIEQYKRKFA